MKGPYILNIQNNLAEILEGSNLENLGNHTRPVPAQIRCGCHSLHPAPRQESWPHSPHLSELPPYTLSQYRQSSGI